MNLMNLFRQTLPPEAPEVQYDVRTQEERDEIRRLRAANEKLVTDKLSLESLASDVDRVASMYRDKFEKAKAERDAALAELAPLKAVREKQLANLTEANARRRAAALREPAPAHWPNGITPAA